ncbi:hypothetical protein COLO4_16564, partial [Corchorus olitorius]
VGFRRRKSASLKIIPSVLPLMSMYWYLGMSLLRMFCMLRVPLGVMELMISVPPRF